MDLSPAETLCHGIDDGGSYQYRQDWLGEGWYFSRKEIEEYSPSRRDGIRLEKETYLRRSYCDFLLELGMRLKLTQVAIATATVFCHRFFLRQSHAKNNMWTIATVCMFLSGKAVENPRPLKEVILASYGIIHKKDPKAEERIKEKKVFEQQKKIILLGEKVVLKTLGYDLCVSLPYPALIEAIKKFEIPLNGLASVAWNFVNDGLRTSLCLQVKPLHIAAGAIFLAAKFLQIDLPLDDEAWWQEFEIRTWQLEEVCYQILEVFEEVQIPPPSEVEGTEASGAADQMPAQATASITSTETKDAPEQTVQVEFKDNLPPESLLPEKMEEARSAAKRGLEGCDEEGQEDTGNVDAPEAGEVKDKQFGRSLVNTQGALGQSDSQT